MNIADLRNEYRPYDSLKEFDEGFAAYQVGNYNNPYDKPWDGYKAQAWDRGLECAMRARRLVQ